MAERKRPTEKQQKVLDFVRFFVLHRGLAPSRPEIAEAVGLKNVSNVGWYLQTLEKKGWLTVLPDTPRGIILDQSERVPVLEVRGPIPDDEPLLIPERTAEYMPELIARVLAPGASFCLLIGESEAGEGLKRGDLIAVRRTQKGWEDAVPGQLVVVRVRGEVMCRVLEERGEAAVKLARVGTNGKAAHGGRLELAMTELELEGVVVRKFGAGELGDIYVPEEAGTE